MIELLYFPECPHVEPTRSTIDDVLRDAHMPRRWAEWNVNDPLTPSDRQGYASPTVLVEGMDVVAAEPAGASACRVYKQPDGSLDGGVPAGLIASSLATVHSTKLDWRGFPRIHTERLAVFTATLQHAPAVLDFYARNRDHLAQWEPARSADFYELAFWQAKIAQDNRAFLDDRCCCFVATLHDSDDVVAVANLRNVVRGVFQACHLGYSVDAAHEGAGYMRETLSAVIDFAFDELGLHRIMANHLPENERSARLLERMGFEKEGYARDYLRIAGQWRDHVLTALVNRQN